MTTTKNYEIVSCVHACQDGHCSHCGLMVPEGTAVTALKTNRYSSINDSSTVRYLRRLQLQSSRHKPLDSAFPLSEALYEYLETIANKFQFGVETLSLGVLFYNEIIKPDQKRKNQAATVNSSPYEKQMDFYSSVCLMVAAKAIQLDRRIPYFSRYLKYADKSKSVKDYENAEKEIIVKLEWLVQKPTYITFLHYYLSNGVVFSDDQFSQKKVFLVQEKIKQLAQKALKNGEFVTKPQQHFATLIVHQARKHFKLQWHPLLAKLTGTEAEKLEDGAEKQLALLTNNNNIKIRALATTTLVPANKQIRGYMTDTKRFQRSNDRQNGSDYKSKDAKASQNNSLSRTQSMLGGLKYVPTNGIIDHKIFKRIEF